MKLHVTSRKGHTILGKPNKCIKISTRPIGKSKMKPVSILIRRQNAKFNVFNDSKYLFNISILKKFLNIWLDPQAHNKMFSFRLTENIEKKILDEEKMRYDKKSIKS